MDSDHRDAASEITNRTLARVAIKAGRRNLDRAQRMSCSEAGGDFAKNYIYISIKKTGHHAR